MLSQIRYPLAGNLRIRIFHGADYPGNAGLYDRFAARRRFPVMGAGFKVDIEGAAGGILSGGDYGMHFGMRSAAHLMVAFTHDEIVLDQQGSDHGIRAGESGSVTGQIQNLMHVKFITVHKKTPEAAASGEDMLTRFQADGYTPAVCYAFFFHPDCNCRLRILTESTLASSRACSLTAYRR